ncbi:MAG TPA: hypothetical protein ENH57_02160 [Actinobacteria bacterium]|nr:hypothetical protein [Actinomycetota bacterium]
MFKPLIIISAETKVKDLNNVNNIVIATVLLAVVLSVGCGANLTEKATKNVGRYKEAVDKAKQTTAQVELKMVETAEEAYHAENGTYASNISDLEQFGQIPDGVTILEANESNFRLKLEKNGQTYYFPDK